MLEQHPAPRTEGFMIDFFGPGVDAAETMNLLPALQEIHYPIAHLRFVDARGEPVAGLSYPRMRKALFADRHFNFMRGDFERVLREKAEKRATIRFGVSPSAIEQTDGEHDGGVHRRDP